MRCCHLVGQISVLVRQAATPSMILLSMAIASGVSLALADDFSGRPNVLFIAVDDLRPTLGCYGDPLASTPNLDRLASAGTIFRRAYCQQAVCSPSRLSLLTGRRPDTTKVWDLNTHFRRALPDVVTLPQHFKESGYDARGIGKIFHGNGKPSTDPRSWSAPPLHDVVRDSRLRYALPKNLAGTGLKRDASEAAEVTDETYIDGIVCQSAVEQLQELSHGDQPFFLAIGFRKPHLPFCAPQKYWDLYDRQQFSMGGHGRLPESAPELATRSWRELEGYRDIPENDKLSSDKARQLRHGYYACVSYVDAMIGRLLDELDALDLSGETVVVVWGDHGFHLGEQGLWTKANNYELATRVPLIVRLPSASQRFSKGKTGVAVGAVQNVTRAQVCDRLVELVDLFPTLSEVCGLPIPDGLEGISFVPLLSDSTLAWKKAAFSQFPRLTKGHRHRSHGDIMGYAMRTDRYRYVEWQAWDSKAIVATELYDHQSDPNEMKNVSGTPAYADVQKRLSQALSAGWRAAKR